MEYNTIRGDFMKAEKRHRSSNYTKQYTKTKKRKHRRVSPLGLLIDLLLSIGIIVAFGYFLWILYPLGLVPTTWIILLALVGIILLLGNLILSLIRTPGFVRGLRRVVIIVLCAALGYGSISVQKIDKAVEEVMKLPTSYKEYISIITLRDSGIIETDELRNKVFGVQRSVDTDHMKMVKDELKDRWGSPIKYHEYEDYYSAIQALYNGNVKAIIMSESYRDIVEENVEDFKEKTAIIDALEIESPVVEIRKDIDVTANAFTVLISGIDTLGKATIKSNSDVNMLITVNPLSKMIVMNSIPRDSYLPNACLNNENDKLTHTGMRGVDCTIKTIENAFDVEINYYAKISFSSVINVINALGGIDVNVPMEFCERKANRTGIMYVHKGPQHLTGEEALALARHRYTLKEGDLGRAKNQQLVINAIVKTVVNKAISGEILSMMDELVQVVGETVQTNISKKEIYDFVNYFVSDLSSEWTLSNHVVSGKNGWGECASLPGMELSVVNLSEEDVNKIKYIIKMAETDSDLSDFSFSINNVNDIKEIEVDGETNGAEGSDKCHLK